MKIITNKQRLEKRLGVSFQILDEFCQQRQITELSVFGSILREDFNFNSDIDLLVKFDTKAHISLMDIIKIENEFKILLKRNIDLVSKKAIENSKNWIRRQNILDSAEIIYVQ
ncbi:nucleotidyltransferase domain-containing protein [Synechocystis sp. PCC 7339]|uniref:nucleotidyltransferase family protein n=1 Tax=unclassified Synechocystis TaxID=2640012 RepID=UPI001BAE6276|nr:MULTISPECIES: nucleotidyltransferase domain-containing protein [unclassified Synechocystis]QUS62153.1 nucleotidyltransferase domain-containing protein [Synechocystis sp. PCC 7338]UAJ71336.1 nucleotidyltransferase domain-containing protein [Synechocystis sp. PCC 7339]